MGMLVDFGIVVCAFVTFSLITLICGCCWRRGRYLRFRQFCAEGLGRLPEEHHEGASEKPRERRKNKKSNERAASAPNRRDQGRYKRGEGSDGGGPVTRSQTKGRKGCL